MKNTLFIVFLLSKLSLTGQTQQGIYDLVHYSDFIVMGKVISIQQHQKSKESFALLTITSIEKGIIKNEKIELVYDHGKTSHHHPVTLQIGIEYIFFMDFDSINNHFLLPFNEYAVFEVKTTEKVVYSSIIKKLLAKIKIQPCDYFNILKEGISLESPAIWKSFWEISTFENNIEERYCIDENDKIDFYNAFKQTLNTSLLSFTFGYQQQKVDSILIATIEILVSEIKTNNKTFEKNFKKRLKIMDFIENHSFMMGNEVIQRKYENKKESMIFSSKSDFLIDVEGVLEQIDD